MTSKSLFVVVGDNSADQHTGRVLAKLKELQPGLKVWGVGGANMAEAGVELIYDCQQFSVIGIVETFKLLPFFAKLKRELIGKVEARQPDAVLLVDFGGFNLSLALELKRRFPHLPIVYFISPQIWGSRPWRIKSIEKTIAKMLVIFPFEQSLYQQRGIPATFVGHPLLGKLEAESHLWDRGQFCRENGLDPQRPIIAIFPGSRIQEMQDLSPVVLEAAEWLLSERSSYQFAISQANEYLLPPLERVIDSQGMRHRLGHGLSVVGPGKNRQLMWAADLIWAKSGTTTLEAALLGKPMLIFYRGNWLSYLLFLAFKTIKYVGWPNILAGYELVPELIQLDCRAELLVRYTRDWMDVPLLRREISQRLKDIKAQLGQGDFALSASQELLSLLGI